MRITLTDDEVRAALFEAVLEKTGHTLPLPNIQDGYFCITNPNGEVADIEIVEYTLDFRAMQP